MEGGVDHRGAPADVVAPAARSRFLAVVRQGQTGLFDCFQRWLAEPELVDIVWDRRVGGRRQRCLPAPTERRRGGDRRAAPRPSWDLLDFVLVPVAPPERSGARSRILVIEDNDRIRAFLCAALEAEDHEVVAAIDGAAALALFRERPADLVLTDIVMPRKDGIETIRELRQLRADIRVIAMTGVRDRHNRLVAARHLGAHRTLMKPFGLEELLAAVRATLAG
jgi:two-component system response regulator (stage 0 sporulation protein F)